jgi:DNA uptake protein ComE-like DNA-binding protein
LSDACREFFNIPGGQWATLRWREKTPQRAAARGPPGTISTLQGGSTTRFRIPGIVCIVLALACSSLLAAQTKSPTTPAPKQMKLKPIDINTAPEEDFALVGIDKATAKKIVQARPFRSKADLVSKQLMTREQYDKVKDLLVAKQPPKK